MTTAPAARRGILRPPPLVAGIAFAKLCLLLSCAGAYGYVRGELYALSCAQHLAWGYAAQPPLSVALLFGVVKLYGESEVTARVLPALASAVVVVLTARLARRFGAGTLAQGLAALAVVVAPGLLAQDHVFSARSLDMVFTLGAFGLAARASTAPKETRLGAWVSLGIVAGLGLENDLSLLVALGALAIGLAVARPAAPGAHFGTGPLTALVVAGVMVSPYFAWQSTHGWPLRLLTLPARLAGGGPAGRLGFVAHQVEAMLPTTMIVWGAGLWALFTVPRLAVYRAFGIAFLLCFAFWAALGTNDADALLPMFPVLLAAGAAALEPWLAPRRWASVALAALLLIPGGALVPSALPVLPVAKYLAYARKLHLAPPSADGLAVLPPRFAGMFGWPELVRSVDSVAASLPAAEREEVVVLASDAGQAGAIDLFGPTVNLPPVISGRGDFWSWGTLGASGNLVIAVGGDEAFLHAHFGTVALVTVFGHSLAAPSERRVRLYLCRDPVAPLDVMWPEFKAPI